MLTLHKLIYRLLGFDLHEITTGIYTTSKAVPGIAISSSRLILIDVRLFHQLTSEEVQAVIQHEIGHQQLRHHSVWIRAMLTGKATTELREQQELEADAYAKQMGLGDSLISFLERALPALKDKPDDLKQLERRIQALRESVYN